MADRNVTVVLTLKGAGDAPKALKDCAAAADSAAKGVGKFEQSSSKIDSSKVTSASKAYGDVAKHATEASKAIAGMNAEAAKTRAAGAPAGAAPARGVGAAPGPQRQQPQFAPEPKAVKEPQAAQAPGLAGSLGVDPKTLEIAAQAGAFGAAVSATGKALSAFAGGLDKLTDSSLSTNAALARMGESIPIIGDIVRGFRDIADVVSGKNELKRKQARQGAVDAASASGETAAFQQNAPLRQQITTIQAQAAATNLPGGFGQGGFFGLPPGASQAEKDQARAGRDVAAASTVQDDARRRREALEAQLKVAEETRKKTQDNFKALKDAERERSRPDTDSATGRARSGAQAAASALPDGTLKTLFGLTAKAAGNLGTTANFLNNPVRAFSTAAVTDSFESKEKLKAGGDVKTALLEEEKLRSKLITTVQQEAEAVKATEEAKRRERQAGIQILKDEIAVLKDKANQIASQATSFGSLDASQQFSAIQAAKQFKEKGFETLTPEQRAILQQAGAGGNLAEAAKKFALKDEGFKEFQTALGNEFDLEMKQKQIVKAEVELDLKVELDETKFANALKDSVVPLLEKLVEQQDKVVKALVAKVEIDQDMNQFNNQ